MSNGFVGQVAMLAGILIGGILAGILSLLAGLAFSWGLAITVLGYVAGGMCGCLVCAGLIAAWRDPEQG